jgi:hypothetical protein
MEKHFYQPDLTPSMAEDPGWTGEVDSFGGRHPVTREAKVRSRLRESAPLTEDVFDDTFKLVEIHLTDTEREASPMRRLREHGPGQFSRGVPTNSQTSSKNYKSDPIIDGEHKTLLSLGKINEAFEDDDHMSHIHEHRMLLANPNLSETQRAGLMAHVDSHKKESRKKLKAVQAAQEGNEGKYKKGFGVLSKPKTATTYNVIPQDSQVSNERKRTAGNMSMESGASSRASKINRFENAVRNTYGNRRGL